ncbi:MAG TPA: tRNA-dihydrouridine synthase, partial [Bacillota bacterium]|nr:tRNA-dihydrouridine synthase [Bacillota bacterium]
MQIGELTLVNRIIAAPMAGVSDKPFRILAKESGCGLVCTEMISDMALVYNNRRTFEMLDIEGEEHPISVQIFGSQPETMAQAAELVVREGADIVDINMGCPAPKICRNNEGSALLKDLPLAEKIITAVVRAVQAPVTVKMRKGWDANSTTAVELARLAEAAGAAAVTVHG